MGFQGAFECICVFWNTQKKHMHTRRFVWWLWGCRHRRRYHRVYLCLSHNKIIDKEQYNRLSVIDAQVLLCLTTESMHQQQSNRTSAPCAVFSISSRQIYTSLHSLNNNNKHTLSHLIFPMTPSLLLLPLQPSSMPPPALPLLYSPPEFTNNPMVLGMVRRNSIHSTPMYVLFSPFSSHRMLCFVLFCCFCCVIV